MRCHQLKRAIDAILSLMPKKIRGKLLTPNVHMDAIYIRSLFSASDRALIGSQPSRRCATGRLTRQAGDRRCSAAESSVAVQMIACPSVPMPLPLPPFNTRSARFQATSTGSRGSLSTIVVPRKFRRRIFLFALCLLHFIISLQTVWRRGPREYSPLPKSVHRPKQHFFVWQQFGQSVSVSVPKLPGRALRMPTLYLQRRKE